MSELEAVDRFLYEYLSAIAPTYNGSPPSRATYPLIEFNLVSSKDLSPQGERHGFVAEYRIVARSFGREYPYELQEEIGNLLHLTTAVSENLWLRCERLSSITKTDTVAPTPLREAGGLFQITASTLREAF